MAFTASPERLSVGWRFAISASMVEKERLLGAYAAALRDFCQREGHLFINPNPALLVPVNDARLRQVDVVVTDRLHVGIMSYLLGKEVFLLDNDYGKLSAVYAHSLHSAGNVHLLRDAKLPPALQAAWSRFNSLPRRIGYGSRSLCRRLGRALLRRFRLRA